MSEDDFLKLILSQNNIDPDGVLNSTSVADSESVMTYEDLMSFAIESKRIEFEYLNFYPLITRPENAVAMVICA